MDVETSRRTADLQKGSEERALEIYILTAQLETYQQEQVTSQEAELEKEVQELHEEMGRFTTDSRANSQSEVTDMQDLTRTARRSHWVAVPSIAVLRALPLDRIAEWSV